MADRELVSTARDAIVVDAAALVDLLVGGELGTAVAGRLHGAVLHAPAHVDAEVLSALGRLHRAGAVSAGDVGDRLRVVAESPLERHSLPPLVQGAWSRRSWLRLADALYVELAERLEVPLITTDRRLARAARIAEAVTTAL